MFVVVYFWRLLLFRFFSLLNTGLIVLLMRFFRIVLTKNLGIYFVYIELRSISELKEMKVLVLELLGISNKFFVYNLSIKFYIFTQLSVRFLP